MFKNKFCRCDFKCYVMVFIVLEYLDGIGKVFWYRIFMLRFVKGGWVECVDIMFFYYDMCFVEEFDEENFNKFIMR